VILTVTPNTALDHVVVIDRYVPGAHLRVLGQAECISGKGTVVSAIASDFGARSVALGFAAGRRGQRLAELLRARGVRPDLSPAQGETRQIVIVVEWERHGQTWLMPQTLAVRPAHEHHLEERAARWLPNSSWLVLCGSLPPGCSPKLYQRLIKRAHRAEIPVLLDTRGTALTEALSTEPDAVKLNREELEATLRRRLLTSAALVAGLRRLLARGARLAICTLGAQGALVVTREFGWRVTSPRVETRSSAGSGDAFTAALLKWKEDGADWPEALRWAAAAGAAKALEACTDRLELKKVHALARRVKVTALWQK
jgi:1-phosphofructokinase family hexose kinase